MTIVTLVSGCALSTLPILCHQHPCSRVSGNTSWTGGPEPQGTVADREHRRGHATALTAAGRSSDDSGVTRWYGLHRGDSRPTTSPSRVPPCAPRSPWRVPAPQPPSPAGGTPAEAWVPHGSSSDPPPALWALEEGEEHPAAQTSWPPASCEPPSSSGSLLSWPPASCGLQAFALQPSSSGRGSSCAWRSWSCSFSPALLSPSLSWASAPFISSGRGEVPRKGKDGGFPLRVRLAQGNCCVGWSPCLGDRSAVAGKHQRKHQRNWVDSSNLVRR